MQDTTNIQIRGEPISETKCKFVVDRAVLPDKSFYFGNARQATGSPLAEALFKITGVTNVLISHDTITVGKGTHEEWPVVGKQIGAAIRASIASGQPAVSDDAFRGLPPAEELRNRVQEILDSQINPYVASHGGVVRLIDVRDNNVFVQMGGGCQGCGMANVTLRQGVEVAIRASIPEVGDILDTTDHAAGRNPFYSPSKK